MNDHQKSHLSFFRARPESSGIGRTMIIAVAAAATAHAQADPWSTTAGKLGADFSGPIVRGLGLVAIVVGGLEVAFSEGGSRRTIGGLIFGLGLALGAASFISYFFSS
jgi:type IV secretory pathway VirB2 component (pilin)